MNTELQNKVWSILPKEFKEEVKKEYYDCKHCNADACAIELETVFGKHNLTSDAELEEELYVSRKKLQYFYEKLRAVGENHAAFALQSLFGSKCLPNELNEDNFAKSEPKPSEPKFKKWDKVLVKADTAISKDMEIYKKLPSEIKRIDGETALIGMLPNVMICDMQVRLGNLEPYTEPTQQPTTDCSNLDKQASTCTNVCTSQSAPNPNPETVRNLRKSDEDSESEALLN